MNQKKIRLFLEVINRFFFNAHVKKEETDTRLLFRGHYVVFGHNNEHMKNHPTPPPPPPKKKKSIVNSAMKHFRT